MNTNTNRSADVVIPETYLEGLALDVSILDALLKRHRCSHGRTIYFRRMNMTLNRLLRRENHQGRIVRKKIVVADAVYRLKDLQKNINDYHQEQNRKRMSKKRWHDEKEERWDLQSLHKKATSAAPSSKSELIGQEFQELIHIWTRNIPEILSRIQHASKSLFIEVSRGFFLPFCTVALSALARIRSLLMEVGIRGLTKIRNLSDEVLEILPKNDNGSIRPMLADTDYDQCMNLFLENDEDNDKKIKSIMRNSSSTKKIIYDQSAILKSLGLMESTKSNSKATGRLKCDDSDVPTNNDESNDNEQEHKPFAIESSSADDYYTLSASVPLEHHLSDDDGVNIDDRKMAPKPRESLDRNTALVDRFQKRKTNDNQSEKKRKKSKKKIELDSEPEFLSVEAERKNQKRKSKKNKDSTKTKKKKKAKKVKSDDIFDQIFD